MKNNKITFNLYDENGNAVWPNISINSTNKTQFVTRINKGVLDETNDIDLNRSTKDEDKYIYILDLTERGKEQEEQQERGRQKG